MGGSDLWVYKALISGLKAPTSVYQGLYWVPKGLSWGYKRSPESPQTLRTALLKLHHQALVPKASVTLATSLLLVGLSIPQICRNSAVCHSNSLCFVLADIAATLLTATTTQMASQDNKSDNNVFLVLISTAYPVIRKTKDGESIIFKNGFNTM